MSKSLASIGASALLVLAVIPSAAAGPTTPDRATVRQELGSVSFGVPLWTATPGEHHTTVSVRYPNDAPPTNWDGQPVEIQVRHQGGERTTVGTADQEPVAGEAASRTRVTYTLPIDGDVRIRAEAHSTNSSITSKAKPLTVTPTAPAYNPTALPHTRYGCWDPVIAQNPSRLAYGCPNGGEYGYDSWRYDVGADKREYFGGYTDYPVLAAKANVAVGHSLVYQGEDLQTYRARRYNLNTGKSTWIAFTRNGRRAYEAVDASISANAKRIAYASRTRGISPKASGMGRHVYSVLVGKKRSRFLGKGDETEISAYGRHVVWRNPKGKIKRIDLRTGKRISITKRTDRSRHDPDVSAAGRYVSYVQGKKADRIVRVYDAKTGKRTTVAKGSAPVISDNGRFVAYLGPKQTDLYVWNRSTGRSELISVGPSGDGSGGWLAVPDISPNGRWVVAATRSAAVAPDNGRKDGQRQIVLFDRNAV